MECPRDSRTSSQTRTGSPHDRGQAGSGTASGNGQTLPGTRAFAAQANGHSRGSGQAC